jgi:ABC-type transport system substrate-binding protein
MTVQLAVAGDSVSAADEPTAYFSLTLIAPTNNPARVQHAQVIKEEFWKIGIQADLVLVGWDILIPRLFESVNFETYDGDGFDVGFVGWTGSPLLPGAFRQFFHSANINKASGASNYYPINDSNLDVVLDNMQAEVDFDQRREYVRQAMDTIIWDYHPVTGIYQVTNPYAIDADVTGFDPTRASFGAVTLPEMSFGSGPSDFLFATNARFIDLNPIISSSYYDNLIFNPVFSSLYEQDADLIYRPVLADIYPIPVGSNQTLVETGVSVASISADSPWDGSDVTTVWGSNPNIDDASFNPNVTAEDRSMFLIRIRENIPWQPGYGYTLGEYNVTADDFVWTISYLLNEDVPAPNLASAQAVYGTDYTQCIEKINETTFKINYAGPLGDGRVADWLPNLAIAPYPSHILDPAVGSTPDGTTVAAYADHRTYRYNTGQGTYPLVGCGPYTLESWDETGQLARLEKFDDWGGYGANSLWSEAAYSANNIDVYGVTVYSGKDAAIIALENEEIDGIDSQFQMGRDIPYLSSKTNIQVLMLEDSGIQTMGYNTFHPKLGNRYVRLAISHVVPRQTIVDYILGGLGVVNEVVGIARQNPYMPSETEWATIGLPTSLNTVDDEGNAIEFQGHIRYNLDKAWALMEYAGYDMDPWRAYVDRGAEETGEPDESDDTPLPLLPIVFAILTAGVIVSRRRN